MNRFTVPSEMNGERLDRALSTLCSEHSRAAVQRHINSGAVSLNGALPARGAKTTVREGDLIEHLPPPDPPLGVTPEPMDLAILHEDEDILVLNKAAGVVVHPGHGNHHGTLVQGVLHHLGHELPGPPERPGIVHRLDRDTTGVIVIAKGSTAHARIAEQFAEREVGKEYVAVALGRPKESFRLDTHYGRDPKDRKKFSSRVAGGKRAVTDFQVEQRFDGCARLRVDLGTGRTHQIRVHLADAGHPLLGDETYGGRRLARAERSDPRLAFSRPALHARRLSLRHPRTGEALSFEAPLPADLRRLVQDLEGAA